MSELRMLQAALLDLALETDRICRMKEIPYSLCGGSLLGAVRHKGFIPWDDDMDMVMLREDYERFINLCSTELDSAYFIQTYEQDALYANSFAKVGIKGTRLLNPQIENESVEQSISIDIFPLDVFPQREYKRKILYFREQNYCMAAYLKAGYQVDQPLSFQGKIRRELIRIYSRNRSLRHILAKQTKLEKKYNNGTTKKSEIGIVFFNESYVSPKCFLDAIDGEFEGYYFPIPREFDKVLRGIFGNYMELPPEEKRAAHNFAKVDFGAYEIRNHMIVQRDQEE